MAQKSVDADANCPTFRVNRTYVDQGRSFQAKRFMKGVLPPVPCLPIIISDACQLATTHL